MVEAKQNCEKDDKMQPNLLNKFSDATSAIVELIILIIEKIGIHVPESAKNEIGIILLLIPIYVSGDLFTRSATMPMIFFGVIVIYTVVMILSANNEKISRFLRGKTRAENIIKQIKEGTLANASEDISLTTFDAESLDNLLIDLSKEGLLTYNIQNAIVNTQTLYPKNLRTLFNKNSNINIHEDFVMKILSSNGIKQQLTDEQIQNIIAKYGNNIRIIISLLLNQPQSFKIIKDIDNEDIKRILTNYETYREKPFFSDRYFKLINNIVRFVLGFIFIIFMLAFAQDLPQLRSQSSPEQFAATFLIFMVIIIGIFLKTHSFIRGRIRMDINKKINYILNMNFTQPLKINKKSAHDSQSQGD